MAYLQSIWDMTVEAAPWLVIGLIAAAVIRAWVPTAWISRQLGRRDWRSVVKASVLGIPLPLCSCGVLPTALGLRRQGASRPATASFLVSTPEIGLDSFALSYVLLGPFMAIVRPIAAFASAIAAGVATLWIGEPDEQHEASGNGGRAGADAGAAAGAEQGACCAGQAGAGRDAGAKPQAAGGCCEQGAEHAHHAHAAGVGEAAGTAAERLNAAQRLGESLGYVFGKLWDDIKGWLAVALVVAGVVFAAVGGQPTEALVHFTSGMWAPLAMAAMVVIGVPLYVCATASTPIAAALLVAGVSPGTVLVLLLAGPATNLGSVAILRKELGPRSVIAYLLAIALASIGAGLSVDWIVNAWGISMISQTQHAHHLIPSWVGVIAAVWLIAMAFPPVRRLIWRPRQPGGPKGQSCCSGEAGAAGEAGAKPQAAPNPVN